MWCDIRCDDDDAVNHEDNELSSLYLHLCIYETLLSKAARLLKVYIFWTHDFVASAMLLKSFELFIHQRILKCTIRYYSVFVE